MSLTEPPVKKVKIDHSIDAIDNYVENIRDSTKPLKMIIEEDLFNPVPLTKVYVGQVKNTSMISKTVMLLNEKIPLNGLQHLKRVRKSNIILCPGSFLNGTSSIQEYLEKNCPELNDVFDYFKEVDVPATPPKVTSQYKEATKLWSVNFHPNKYLENIVRDTIFKTNQLGFHRKLMAMTFEVAKWYMVQQNRPIDNDDMFKDINVGIVYDPTAQLVVAVAFDNRIKHPLQHATMLAIDNVAKTQNGGAWVLQEEIYQSDGELCGINMDLQVYLSEKFHDVRFGARPFVNKMDMLLNNEDLSTGPYLCTGYYIYLLREPCFMCAMGLVHARICRTFFCFENKDHGALSSLTKLHLNPSLNHRFEAFTGFL
ncbi:probable inactive tRNA-specific adenosine deaminase-like protein 3 [Epargyreus clarus]|uniref:probable inactive tRNA-specific adenosine deaminase-like protein 3 n=1 Tax=Epargyreus clarus TaxID=520877 RepID=UPI003C2D68AA